MDGILDRSYGRQSTILMTGIKKQKSRLGQMKKYDVIIVGAGPAGLTAGVYVGRAGKSAAIFEKESPGGQIVNTNEIDNFPAVPGISGFEYAMKLQEQAKKFGAEIIFQGITSVSKDGDRFIVKSNQDEYEAQAVILATGLKNRRMGLDNEENLIGKGISFCATCDGMFFRGSDVAVYGGGNTALEDAIVLSSIASKVTIIHRRDRFRGEQELVDQLNQKKNVEFAMNSTVVGVNGSDKLESVTLKDQVSGETRELPVSALFVAIGQIPQGEVFVQIAPLDDYGFYAAGESCETGTAGLFAAGDGRTKDVRQLTTAAGDGTVAATKACQYVDKLAGNEYTNRA